MITVTLSKREMRIRGHARRGRGWPKFSGREVCAAVSMLAAMLRAYCLRDDAPFFIRSGYSRFGYSPRFRREWDFVVLALKTLARDYPQSIRVEE